VTDDTTEERTSINISEAVRDELRRYKADDGLTYDEAIARLLTEVDWIEDESELLPDDSAEEETNS